MKHTGWAVTGLLCFIAVLSIGMTALFGNFAPKPSDGLSVVASFYPMYTAAKQVIGDTDGVTLTCLTQPTAGCLHDYQLSPAERLTLADADILLLNGAGAEGFLSQVLSSEPDLKTVDTSVGIDTVSEEDGAPNEHIWVSPTRYIRQVQNLCNGLCKLDPAHAESYQQNTRRYVENLKGLAEELKSAAAAIEADGAVLFHESMAYVADELELPVLAELPLGEEQGISAGEFADAAEAVKGKRVVFLYDGQYDLPFSTLEEYADSAVSVLWDTAVKANGADDGQAYIRATKQNIACLKGANTP